ncbi:glycosyltransferase family 4 protein [Curtobacterium flaccumfaciens pv. beticola]|uniref:glycosyltransferase family 4 protein n=1 Tax=Curtobacterium flaccumfaciens TaxID=2035 RepID=UPI00349FAC4C|nr:glycosyltransferase family 4 protein [Curtobacterium flaccumfaciens pv. basellae]
MKLTTEFDEQQRVLILAKRFPPLAGGIAQYSVEVARAYARSGHEVIAVTQATTAKGWRRDPVEPHLAVLNVGRGNQAIALVRFLIAVLQVRRSGRFSVVHATTWKMGIVARILLSRVPLVVTIHGREVLNVPNVLRPTFKWVLTGADLVLTVSRATMEAAKGALGGGIRRGSWEVAYNGLSFTGRASTFDRSETPRGDRVRVFSLCRLVPRKNIEGALRAVARARSLSKVAFEYVIAGSGPDRPRLESVAEALGVDDIVTFTGYVADDEVPGLYEAADIFLHPHTHVGEGRDFEGFGIAIADALSFGCACIVGSAGGPSELVEHGVSGLLVDGEDDELVVGALVRLLNDPQLRSELGGAAREQSLQRFSWAEHVEPVSRLFGGGSR